ncbi:purple acid phosphatase family protein [Trichococcus paludicola]|uniref:purple acid phosphatase family protein n=1 Tax=Trichococcus paludicola TaxID=2052942 RepID=UPI00131E2634|nr:metallophosphoesterase family protein [Trichococcus paludicola]
MFKRNYRMKILFATLIMVTVMTGCAKEPYRDSAVEESVATKYTPHILDAFHIAFAPGADETERTFSWHTRGINKKAVVELSRLDEAGNILSSETFEATVEGVLRGQSRHKAIITGLEENQLYSYRFGDGHRAWSESYTFRTQATEDGDFNFLFFGDPQIGAGDGAQIDADGWDRTVTTATEMFPDTAFLVSSGDQVNRANNPIQYDGWFSPEELTAYPIMPIVGNHDAASFADYFNVPNETGWGGDSEDSDFYFTYGNTLFLALNSQSSDVAEHKEAMELAIAANPDAIHRIVLVHKSLYSSADHALDEDVLALRAGLVPAFDELDIDAVLMGHDHVYVRTYQMKGDAVIGETAYNEEGAAVDPDGTVYLTGNSASDSKYYEMRDPSVYDRYSAVALQLEEPTYMNVEVTDDSLTFTTYKVSDQSVVDAYSIVKTFGEE